MSGLDLDAPLGALSGKLRKPLEKLGLVTHGDLLRHFPRRYLVPNELTDLNALPVGELVTVVAEVRKAEAHAMRARRGKVMTVVVTDRTGQLTLTFFGNTWPHEQKLVPGARAVFTGTVKVFNGGRQLTHPVYEPLPSELDLDSPEAQAKLNRPIPVYPLTAKVTSPELARLIGAVLDVLGEVDDPLPEELRRKHKLLGLTKAFHQIHQPASAEEYLAAQKRFRYEEAFVLQTALLRRRAQQQDLAATARTGRDGGLLDAFDAKLPFALTEGQVAVSEEIAEDLARTWPMHRLLQGEVGSGKTVVALRAMLRVVDSGGQAALLAPTEVLAVQHHRSMEAMLGDLAAAGMLGSAEDSTRVTLLTGSMSTAERRKAMLLIASGEAGVVVGTHALLQDKVQFADLGLVVVDEQHRFGVEQRTALSNKAVTTPHTLVMTATPIPRTVAMTVFGDLDVSTLTELPRGRSPITTHLVDSGKPKWLERAWQLMRQQIDAGHQVFVVCPRIGEGETEELELPDEDAGDDGDTGPKPAAVLEVIEGLRELPQLAGTRIEMLHGRMPADARDEVMKAFTRGDVDVLVATTVIEVGVDVPNATVMAVLDADRFGISQLHQLRGRVGRGSAPGLCFLFTGVEAVSDAGVRLKAVADTLDGFELARVDLEQRREGDVLGSAQSGGRSSLQLLRVLKHADVIAKMREEAADLVARDRDLEDHPLLERAIASRLDPEREAYLDRG